jgi:hypothetical protein
MNNENLKKQLIKLGNSNPDLRPHIRAVLSTSKTGSTLGQLKKDAELKFLYKVGEMLQGAIQRRIGRDVDTISTKSTYSPHPGSRTLVTITVDNMTMLFEVVLLDKATPDRVSWINQTTSRKIRPVLLGVYDHTKPQGLALQIADTLSWFLERAL